MGIKQIQVQYFAVLREQRGVNQETLSTPAKTARELYRELADKHHFKIPIQVLKVAINFEFTDWDRELKADDTVTFIPPVAGG